MDIYYITTITYDLNLIIDYLFKVDRDKQYKEWRVKGQCLLGF